MPAPQTIDTFTACPDCDLIIPMCEVPVHHTLYCPRCRKKIWRRVDNSTVRVLALSISGLLLYLPSMLLPLMTFKSLGFEDSANVVESIINFYNNGYYFVSFMVLLSAAVLPLLLLSQIFLISLNISLKKYPRYMGAMFRTYLHLEEWAMVEVYLLGIFITVIKMKDTSEIGYHSGLFCFVLLVIISLTISITIDKHLFWEMIAGRGKIVSPQKPVVPANSAGITAASQGMTLCCTCHLLNQGGEGTHCIRCGEILRSRIHNSNSKTWALITTSALFLIPANVLPIMQVDFLGIPDRSTIMDGIIYFFNDGSYLIGLIIFSASILVPVFKIIGLGLLLLTRQPCSPLRLRQKTQLYRFIAFIGRWSMLDVFVIALLTVLVYFGFFTTIHTAPAATYFCLVVASTMFAAITFDPRLIWDKCIPCSTTISEIFTLTKNRQQS